MNVQEFAVKNGVKNALVYGACEERVFERMASECGYTRKTTFFSDLSLAEWLGADSVRDTYNNVVKSWFNDKVYFTEFVMSLNWKIWEQNARGNEELARVYDELWKKADTLVMEKWTGEDLSYYLQTTD